MSPSLVTHTRAGPSFVCASSLNGAGANHIRLSGELDLAVTSEVKRALSRALERADVVVVDLRDLVFMDSAGVHALVDATADAHHQGQYVQIIPGPPHVHSVFALTGTADDVQVTARQTLAA